MSRSFSSILIAIFVISAFITAGGLLWMHKSSPEHESVHRIQAVAPSESDSTADLPEPTARLATGRSPQELAEQARVFLAIRDFETARNLIQRGTALDPLNPLWDQLRETIESSEREEARVLRMPPEPRRSPMAREGPKGFESGAPLSAPSFPWPPPRASAMMIVPTDHMRAKGETLGDIETVLRNALLSEGYSDISCFVVPEGFALVTRLEKITADGTALPGVGRWATELSSIGTLSLLSRVREFFFLEPGLFRIMVFVVTSQSFVQRAEEVSREVATEWTAYGANRLPAEVSTRLAGPDVTTTLLVYEFTQPRKEAPATLQSPGSHSGREHLEKSGIWAALIPHGGG